MDHGLRNQVALQVCFTWSTRLLETLLAQNGVPKSLASSSVTSVRELEGTLTRYGHL